MCQKVSVLFNNCPIPETLVIIATNYLKAYPVSLTIFIPDLPQICLLRIRLPGHPNVTDIGYLSFTKDSEKFPLSLVSPRTPFGSGTLPVKGFDGCLSYHGVAVFEMPATAGSSDDTD